MRIAKKPTPQALAAGPAEAEGSAAEFIRGMGMKKKAKAVLKIRRWADGCRYVTVHLLHRHVAADECLLFGEMPPERAEWLAEQLGVLVEREEVPIDPGPPMAERRGRQPGLFDGG